MKKAAIKAQAVAHQKSAAFYTTADISKYYKARQD